jgi:hypothetical protein
MGKSISQRSRKIAAGFFGSLFAGLPTFVQQNAPMANQDTSRFPRYTLTDQLQQQIRTIAKQLPPMCEEYKTHNQVSGAELIAQGHYTLKRGGLIQPVVIGGTYPLPSVALRDVNHYDKLVEYYALKGLAGVHEYLSIIPGYLAAMQGQYPSLFDISGKYLGVEPGTQMQPDKSFINQARRLQEADRSAANN